MTGHEDRHDDCQPSGGHYAGHPGLPDRGERHDCCERQHQRAEPENLPPLHDRQPLASLRVPASRWHYRTAQVVDPQPRLSVLRN